MSNPISTLSRHDPDAIDARATYIEIIAINQSKREQLF